MRYYELFIESKTNYSLFVKLEGTYHKKQQVLDACTKQNLWENEGDASKVRKVRNVTPKDWNYLLS